MNRLYMLGTAAMLLCAACRPSAPEPVDHEAVIASLESSVLPSFVVVGHEEPAVPLAELMAQAHVPGVSVAVWMDGEIAWARGFGTADVEAGRAVTPATLFQAASISKPVAATAALSLAQEGRLDLDADVNSILTSWSVPGNGFTTDEKVTVRRLVSHTAGTTVHGFPGYERGSEIPDAVEVLDGKGNTDSVVVFRAPGAGWQYSGGGYTILQQALVDLAGMDFPTLLQERVLGPAGMTSSTYEQPLPEARWGEAATAYREDGSEVEGKWHVYPEMAAAGLWTTPSDLARWAISIQKALSGSEEAVLSPATAREMVTVVASRYGLGVGVSEDGLTFGHGGSNEGFRCEVRAFLDGRGGIAVMTNGDAGGSIIGPVLRTLGEAYGWPGFGPDRRTPVEIPDDALRAVSGRYEVDAVGEIAIEPAEGLLVVTGPAFEEPLRFFPESETRFFQADDGMLLVFESEGDRITGLTVAGMLHGKRLQ